MCRLAPPPADPWFGEAAKWLVLHVGWLEYFPVFVVQSNTLSTYEVSVNTEPTSLSSVDCRVILERGGGPASLA